MKKWLALLLALVCLLSLCACEQEDESEQEEKYVTVYLPAKETCDDGSITQYTYDEKGNKLEDVTYRNGEESSRRTYAYDDHDNITQYKSYSDGKIDESYSYTCTYVAVQMTRAQAKKLGYL